ncbi:hypothetical protein Prudu_018880 [Prunus dulcis]|uniref:Uncharacterized protein n=1 Tax=Prunus dulcis TaxID=3755 RepID=A0A4Y1RT62_PRUDU|nr:hypothetical protein Prudu_018880 [Prunus dulcis]
MHAPGVRLTSRRDPREVQLARTSSLRRTKETARAISLASAPPPKWKTLGMVKLQGRLCRIFGRSRKKIKLKKGCRTRTGVGSVFKAKIGSGPAPGVRLTSRRDPREVQLARTSSLRRTKETARAISLASAPPPKYFGYGQITGETLPNFRQKSEED